MQRIDQASRTASCAATIIVAQSGWCRVRRMKRTPRPVFEVVEFAAHPRCGHHHRRDRGFPENQAEFSEASYVETMGFSRVTCFPFPPGGTQAAVMPDGIQSREGRAGQPHDGGRSPGASAIYGRRSERPFRALEEEKRPVGHRYLRGRWSGEDLQGEIRRAAGKDRG